MGVISWLLRVAIVSGSALLGNYVGEFLRNPSQNPDTVKMGLVRTNVEGGSVVGVRLVVTNFVPALIFAYFAGPPRFLAAFLSGAVVSALIGDKYEPK